MEKNGKYMYEFRFNKTCSAAYGIRMACPFFQLYLQSGVDLIVTCVCICEGLDKGWGDEGLEFSNH